MCDVGKNYAQLTVEDKETINQILIICGAQLSKLIDSHPDPKRYSKKVLKYIQSKKNIAFVLLFLNLKNMEFSRPYTSNELNKKLAKDIGYNTEQQTIIADFKNELDNNKRYLKPSTMSKALKTLQQEGLLLNIRGKREAKHIRSLRGKRKSKEYSTFARGGYISYHELSLDVDRLKKVMSKPKAVEVIHNSLKKSGWLHKYLKLLIKDSFYIVRNSKEQDNSMYELVKGANPYIQSGRSSWKSFRKYLLSLDDQQLEQAAEKLAIHTMKNPNGLHYVLYRLSKL
jgi:hypothetical protein